MSLAIQQSARFQCYRVGDDKNSPLLKGAEKGSTVSATILKRNSEKVTMLTENDETIEAKASDVVGEVGDKVYFEVKDNKNGLMLKQIFPNAPENKESLSSATIEELFIQSNFTKEDKNVLAQPSEEELKEAQAIARIRQQLSGANKNLRRAAVNALLKEGINLQNISISMLSKTLGKAGGVPSQDKIKETLEIVKSKAQSIGNLDPTTVVKFIGDGKEPTLENLYTAKFSSTENGEIKPNLSEKEWNDLLPQLKKLFRKEGIEYNKETEKFAKLFIENNIPITKENMNKAFMLSSLENLADMDAVLETAKNLIVLGENPYAVRVLEFGFAVQNESDSAGQSAKLTAKADILKRAEKILEKLPFLNEEHIKSVINQNRVVNLSNLVSAANDNITLPQTNNNSIVSAQLNLAEIQLKLSYEASVKLINKGLEIDLMPIQELVQRLREAEKEAYAGLFGDGDNSANLEQKVESISNLYDALRLSQPLTPNVYGDILNKTADFTVDNIYKAVRFAKAVSSHETLPNPKYGDNFGKVKEALKDFVAGLGLEASEENFKAASILSRNEIEVTAENIQEIKAIDNKIQDVYNRLHPNIAASMIEDGLNPLEMHVDDVLAYIEQFNDQYGVNLSDRIPELIADQRLDLSEEQRQSMLAVYRMLNMVKKNGSLSLGVAFKNNLDYTLGNLLEAAKNPGKVSRKDYIADESFGGLDIKNNEKNIRSTLEKTAAENADRALGNLRRKGHPFVFADMMKTTPDYEHIPVDKLSQILDNIYLRELKNIEKAEFERAVQLLQQGMSLSPEALKLSESGIIPQTLLGMGLLHEYNPSAPEDVLNRLDDEEINQAIPGTDLEELLQGITPDDILQDISYRLALLQSKPQPEDMLRDIRLAMNAIKVQEFTKKQHDLDFSLPIKLTGGVSTLNMHVVNGENLLSGNAQILLSLNTKNLGKIQGMLDIQNSDVSLTLTAPNQQSLELLKSNESLFTDFIKENGYNLKEINYETISG